MKLLNTKIGSIISKRKTSKNSAAPFSRKQRFTYQLPIIVVAIFGCVMLAHTVFADIQAYNFTNPADFTYDNNKIEVSSNEAKLKPKGSPNWYNASWTKRKPVTITGSTAGAQTDYQMKITVPYDPDMQNDFDDVRFTDTDGTTLLSYWTESKTNSSTADFWVEVPNIPASPGTAEIYIYYGNASASTASSGVDAFISGTDFAGDDGFSYRDNGSSESYGNSSGAMRSDAGNLSLSGINRSSDSYVRKNFATSTDSIIGSVVSHAALDAPEDVFIDGDYAYVPTRSGAKLSVYNISNPASPTFVSSFTDVDLTEAMGVAKNGNILYLTSWHNHKLLILDVTNPANITKISSITIGTTEGGGDPDELRKVAYQSGYVYLTHSHDQRLYIVDVSNPASPSITGSVMTGDGAFAVYVKGNYAYVGGCFVGSSLKIIDISNKAAPSVAKTLSSGNYNCTAGFASSGDNLYAVYYSSNTFVTFDISDPPNTTQKGILSSPSLNQPNRVTMSGNTAYVASAGGNAIVQVDITNPASPTLGPIKSDPLLNRAYGVDYANGKVFAVGRDADSLVVYDPSIIETNNSISDNFSIRTKFRVTAADAASWLPVTGISANGSAINSVSGAYSLNPIWYNNTIQVIEFFGTGGTYYKQASGTVPVSLNTTYIMELKKTGSSATLSIYQTNGTLVGSSVISSLTNPTVAYKWLMPFHNTANNANWPAKTSSQDIYFSFLRKHVSPEPTYTVGSEINIYPTDNPTIQPTAATTFTSLSGFSDTTTLNGGSVKYQVSNDGGTTWYWYDSGWTVAASGYAEANTASDINTNIATLPVGDGQFLWRAYLYSDGVQLVKIGSVDVDYENIPPNPGTNPDAPTSLAATRGNAQVSLSWTAPASNGGSAITDYIVQYKPSADATWQTFNDGTSTDTNAVVTGLTNGAPYDFRVRAVNAAGESNNSNTTSAKPATTPSTPSITATPEAAGMKLTWNAPASGGEAISDYTIQFKKTSDSTWTTHNNGVSTNTTVTITNLDLNTSYDFRVAAKNSLGTSDFSATQTATTLANAVILNNAENSKPVTLATPQDTELTCRSAVKENSLDEQDNNFNYPLGLVNFCFDTNEADNQVVLTFVTNLKPNDVTARKYNSDTKEFADIPGATITQTTVNGQAALRLTYVITDNGPLDQDPATGKIVDPAGLGVNSTSGGGSTGTGGASGNSASGAVKGASDNSSAPNTGLNKQGIAIYIAAAIGGLALAFGSYLLYKRTHAAAKK